MFEKKAHSYRYILLCGQNGYVLPLTGKATGLKIFTIPAVDNDKTF